MPFRVMETALTGLEVAKAMVETGNPNSITDAAVGALALRACIRGAFLNVRINAKDLDDKSYVDDIISKGDKIEKASEEAELYIIGVLNRKLGT